MPCVRSCLNIIIFGAPTITLLVLHIFGIIRNNELQAQTSTDDVAIVISEGTEKVKRLIKSYENDYMSRRYRQYTPSIVYVLEGFKGGFGVIMLHLWLCHFVAEMSDVPFHVLVKPSWHYYGFFDLMNDFAALSDYPVVMDSANKTQQLQYPNLPWKINSLRLQHNSSLHRDHHFVVNLGQNWLFITDSFNYTEIHTDEQLFVKLQVLAQTMWSLNSIMRRQIDVMRKLLFGSRKFIAVHIRGGMDKIGREMDYLPVCEYVKRVRSLQRFFPRGNAVSVFVFSNDHNLEIEFRRQLLNYSRNWRVATWEDGINLLEGIQNRTGDVLVPHNMTYQKIRDSHRKIHNLIFDSQSDENVYHTHEVVSTLSLASHSDKLVCSMNSNLCKLSAVLRPSGLETVIRMDNAVWTAKWKPQLGYKADCSDQSVFKSWCDDSKSHLNCKVFFQNGTIL